jgi:hypothetical protein
MTIAKDLPRCSCGGLPKRHDTVDDTHDPVTTFWVTCKRCGNTTSHLIETPAAADAAWLNGEVVTAAQFYEEALRGATYMQEPSVAGKS